MSATGRLNKMQRRFIEILMEPADSQPPGEIAQRIGVSVKTFKKYCNDVHLLQLAYQQSTMQSFSRLPRLLLVQTAKAEEGDLNAAKFVLQHAKEMGLATMESDHLTTEDVIRLIKEIVREQQEGEVGGGL
jgi:hypothetical protein